jgi:hypothetical protein
LANFGIQAKTEEDKKKDRQWEKDYGIVEGTLPRLRLSMAMFILMQRIAIRTVESMWFRIMITSATNFGSETKRLFLLNNPEMFPNRRGLIEDVIEGKILQLSVKRCLDRFSESAKKSAQLSFDSAKDACGHSLDVFVFQALLTSVLSGANRKDKEFVAQTLVNVINKRIDFNTMQMLKEGETIVESHKKLKPASAGFFMKGIFDLCIWVVAAVGDNAPVIAAGLWIVFEFGIIPMGCLVNLTRTFVARFLKSR